MISTCALKKNVDVLFLILQHAVNLGSFIYVSQSTKERSRVLVYTVRLMSLQHRAEKYEYECVNRAHNCKISVRFYG